MPYIDYAQIKHLISLDTMIDSLNLRRRVRSIHCPNAGAHPHPTLLCGGPAWAMVPVAHFQPFVRLTACEVEPPSER